MKPSFARLREGGLQAAYSRKLARSRRCYIRPMGCFAVSANNGNADLPRSAPALANSDSRLPIRDSRIPALTIPGSYESRMPNPKSRLLQTHRLAALASPQPPFARLREGGLQAAYSRSWLVRDVATSGPWAALLCPRMTEMPIYHDRRRLLPIPIPDSRFPALTIPGSHDSRLLPISNPECRIPAPKIPGSTAMRR